MKLYKLIVVGLFMLAMACDGYKTTAQNKEWLPYGPAIVEIDGKLSVKLKYGPPNFGENPKTDSKVRVPTLTLSRPVNVRADPQDLNNSEVKGVRQVQLILFETPYGSLIGKRVLVKGTLFHANTGGQYTDVVMSVRSIEEKKKTTDR